MNILSTLQKTLLKHLENNIKLYFILTLIFICGVSAGAFTVNGLNFGQYEELKNYISGFMNLISNQKIDSGMLFKISLAENAKIVAALWVFGVTIIGIPFIFILVGIRGFITGFSSGFIIGYLGLKGLLVVLLTLFPKEIIIIPCIIALGVNGINFSLEIIKKKSERKNSKNSLKTNFFSYCFFTLFFSCIILGGILIEAYIIPMLAGNIIPLLNK